MASAGDFLLTELLAHTLCVIGFDDGAGAIAVVLLYQFSHADICDSDFHLFPHFMSNVIVNAGFQGIRKSNQVMDTWDHFVCFV
jgi:hypothetical protein